MFNEEMMKKIRGLKSPEEIMEFAKDSGMTISPEEAKKYYDSMHRSGEISDEDLENAVGGCGSHGASIYRQCPECGSSVPMGQFYDIKVIIGGEVDHQWGYPTGVCPRCNVRYAYDHGSGTLNPVTQDEKGQWIMYLRHRL